MKLFTFFILFTLYSILIVGQVEKPRSISVSCAPFSILTWMAVPCDEFNSMLQSRIKVYTVSSKDSILQLDKLLDRISYAPKNESMDVRAKIVFTNYAGKRFDICISQFYICINGRTIENYTPLFKFLVALIPDDLLAEAGMILKKDAVPDAQTAIKIAEANWLPIYGEGINKNKPFKARLENNKIWIVEGTLPGANEVSGRSISVTVGGVPYIEIQKSDGKILKVTHGK